MRFAFVLLLLVVDWSLAESGFARFAPVSSAVSVLGVWVLAFSISVVLIFNRAFVDSGSMLKRITMALGTAVLIIGGTAALHAAILGLCRPRAEREAISELAACLAAHGPFTFDQMLSDQDHQFVLDSKSADWNLYYANPMFIGYDFRMSLADGRVLGARVSPQAFWADKRDVWIFADFADPPRSRSSSSAP